MASKKTYSVSNVKQLIDLNGDSTNFDITFKVRSHNKEPFHLLVVDQTTLDNNPNLEYKKVDDGEITGSLNHTKDVYQNYFLILKADKPCNCDVEISKKELPKGMVKQQQIQQQENYSPAMSPKKDGFNWMKIMLILAGIIAVCFVIYWFYKSKDKPKQEHVINNDNSPQEFNFYNDFAKSSSPSPSPSDHSEDNPLLQRLKSLNLN